VGSVKFTVSAGDVLAFSLFGTAGNYGFEGGRTPHTEEGSSSNGAQIRALLGKAPTAARNADMAFHTYVEPISVAEPSSIIMLGMGLSITPAYVGNAEADSIDHPLLMWVSLLLLSPGEPLCSVSSR
jgi:hypothetical protein